MISLDTNLLLFAFDSSCSSHEAALGFVESMAERNDVVVSEFVLVEFYRLLRNPAVFKRPLNAPTAVDVVQRYRKHPRWQVVGFPECGSGRLHDQLWRLAGREQFAYRRIYDARLALVLLSFGVTEFATQNVEDFEGLGFRRVWDPVR